MSVVLDTFDGLTFCLYVDLYLVSAVTYSTVGGGSLSVSTKGNWLFYERTIPLASSVRTPRLLLFVLFHFSTVYLLVSCLELSLH